MNDTTRTAVGKTSIRIPALVAIAADLERTLTATTNFADVALDAKDADLAFRSLALAVNKAIDALAAHGGKVSNLDLGDDLSDARCAARMDALVLELAGSLPPVRGGSPDDHEIIDPEFLADPHGWPAEFTPELDGYAWEPTPDHILAAEHDAHADATDWDAYSALSMGLSEADHLVAHGC